MSNPFELMPRQYSPFWLRAVCLISGIAIGLALATTLLMLNGVDGAVCLHEEAVSNTSGGLAEPPYSVAGSFGSRGIGDHRLEGNAIRNVSLINLLLSFPPSY